MAFGDLLELVGGTGRFQIVHVTLLCIPVLMMASHNLLQNFVASVPHHYCSAHTNLSQSTLTPEEKLLITVPLDQTGKPLKCQRYITPQWHLLAKNETSSSGEQGDITDGLAVDLQGCKDGWYYNMTERSSTIISDVGLRIFFQPHAFVYMFMCCLAMRVKLCYIFASGIWCVIYALYIKWDKPSTWEACLWELLSLEVFLTGKYIGMVFLLRSFFLISSLLFNLLSNIYSI